MFSIPASGAGGSSDGAPAAGARPAQAVGGPSRVAGLAALGVLALMVLAYTLGQLGAERSLVADPTPPPLPSPTPRQVPAAIIASPGPPRLVADMLGPGQVLGGLGLGFGNQVLVFCRAADPGSGLTPKVVAVHAGVAAGQHYVIGFDQIAEPGLGTPCRDCSPSRAQLGDEVILIGMCLEDGGESLQVAYAIAANPEFWHSPLALSLRCAGATLNVDRDDLILEPAREPVSGSQRPAFRFSRSEAGFSVDDLELLLTYCNPGGSAQLAGWDGPHRAPSSGGSYIETASAIGVIGVQGSVVVGLDAKQCEALDASTKQGLTLSELTGLDPPSGSRDWSYLCAAAAE